MNDETLAHISPCHTQLDLMHLFTHARSSRQNRSARVGRSATLGIMGQSSSRIVDIKNDFELVVRASKELEHLLETHFQAPSGKMVGLHEKIGAARTRSGEPLTENAVRRMRYLVTIRNSLVHDREVNAIPNRADFVKGWAEVEAELQRLIPQEGSSCVVC
jgi:hypothetical protein